MFKDRMLSLYKYISSFLLAAIVVYTALISVSYAGSVYTSSVVTPQKLMEDTSQDMIQAFIDNAQAIKTDPAIAHKLIDDNLVPKINFPLMSRWVLGKNWRKATVQQRRVFQAEFKKMVVLFYSTALLQFLQGNDLHKDMIKFMPFRDDLKDKYATVRSQVFPPNGADPVKVSYDLYYGKSGQWRVYDVAVEGISLVSSYRSSFNQIISKKGMDAFLSELKSKTNNTSQLIANGK